MPALIAGSAAPPLTAADIKEYRKLAESAPAPVRDAIAELCMMAEVFQETPPTAIRLEMQPRLPKSVVDTIDPVVPWQHECDAMQALFDTLPTGPKDSPAWKLRKAAFHLIHMAQHLTKDLEPLTTDRL